MFIALDKLHNQGLQQAIVVVPERSIGGNFADEALSRHGFFWDWTVAPQWNLCNAPGADEPRIAKSKVEAVRKFLASDTKMLVRTHATFRFAVEGLGIQAFDNRPIAIDEFHHVCANPDNKLGSQLGAFIARYKVHVVVMTGSYFRGDSEAVLGPADESRFETITCTYYEQLDGYRWLKSLDIGYFSIPAAASRRWARCRTLRRPHALRGLRQIPAAVGGDRRRTEGKIGVTSGRVETRIADAENPSSAPAPRSSAVP